VDFAEAVVTWSVPKPPPGEQDTHVSPGGSETVVQLNFDAVGVPPSPGVQDTGATAEVVEGDGRQDGAEPFVVAALPLPPLDVDVFSEPLSSAHSQAEIASPQHKPPQFFTVPRPASADITRSPPKPPLYPATSSVVEAAGKSLDDRELDDLLSRSKPAANKSRVLGMFAKVGSYFSPKSAPNTPTQKLFNFQEPAVPPLTPDKPPPIVDVHFFSSSPASLSARAAGKHKPAKAISRYVDTFNPAAQLEAIGATSQDALRE
jgi:hypothetical protein